MVQPNLTKQNPMPQVALALHMICGTPPCCHSYSTYGGYLLPLAFPEGAPNPLLLSGRTRNRGWRLHHGDQVLRDQVPLGW